MNIDISFDEVTMRNLVSVKADAPEQLLLGEGVCRQLHVITHHLDVSRSREDRAELVVAERRKNRKTERQKCQIKQMKTIQ